MTSDKDTANADETPENFLGRNKKRVKHIIHWASTGQHRKLRRALIDQVAIRSAPLRRLARRSLFQKTRQKMLLKKLLAEYFGLNPSTNRKGIRVALILRDGTFYPKSSAFIRLIAPLTHKSLRGKVSLKIYGENTTVLDSNTAVCIVQRTAYDNEEIASKLISHVQQNNVTLVVDSDDAFHGIDKTHPEHLAHSRRITALNRIIRAADQVWLSVPALAPFYKPSRGKVVTIQNSLDRRIWERRSRTSLTSGRKSRPIQMLYMGTATHDADLKMILPALEAVARAHPGAFTLTIIGVAEELPEKPWIKREFQPKNGSIYPLFINWFRSLGSFDVGLAPLVNSAFNRGKSDIKCLDYLAAGIHPVVSDILPYQSADIRNFVTKVNNTKTDWVDALTKIVVAPAPFRKETSKSLVKAQDYIWKKRSCSDTAGRMLKLIEGTKPVKRR